MTTLLLASLLAQTQPAWHDALTAAMEDEFHAAAVYSAVMSKHGEVRPFVNIHRAELQHQAMLRRVFDHYSLAVPKDTFARQQNETLFRWYTRLGVPLTYKESCALGVQAEIENIALYDKLFKLDLPQDVRQAFERLRSASLNNHLPAFKRCGGQAR